MLSTSWTPIIFKPYRKKCSLQSAWLAGFVEANGNFYAFLRKHSKFRTGYALKFKFSITQKYEKLILESIGSLAREQNTMVPSFQPVPAFIYMYKSKKKRYRLELTKYQDIKTIISYFDRYLLHGKKHITFLRWKRLFIAKDKLKQEVWISEKSFQKLGTLVKAVQNAGF